MAELTNYPIVNQLNSPTLDGRLDENKWFNCVLSCLVGMILYYHPELRGKITPDSLKDAVLGEGYANDGTDAAWFVSYIASHYGLKLSQVAGSPAQHVQQAHQYIQKGTPVMFTEPDPYCTEYQRVQLGWTHVCTWFREVPGGLEAADPFGGILVNKSDTDWNNTVLSKGTWILERIKTLAIPNGWQDDGHTLISPANHQGDPDVHITGPFRDYILANNWPNSNVALSPGVHVDQLELSNKDLGSGFQQLFRFAMLCKPDTGPLAGKVVFEWLGLELAHVRSLLAAEQAQVTSLQSQVASHNPGLDATAVMTRLQAIEIKTTSFATEIGQLATQAF